MRLEKNGEENKKKSVKTIMQWFHYRLTSNLNLQNQTQKSQSKIIIPNWKCFYHNKLR